MITTPTTLRTYGQTEEHTFTAIVSSPQTQSDHEVMLTITIGPAFECALGESRCYMDIMKHD